MKVERSEEWWLGRARAEGDAAVGAGAPEHFPRTKSAWKRLVALWRLNAILGAQQRLVHHLMKLNDDLPPVLAVGNMLAIRAMLDATEGTLDHLLPDNP